MISTSSLRDFLAGASGDSFVSACPLDDFSLIADDEEEDIAANGSGVLASSTVKKISEPTDCCFGGAPTIRPNNRLFLGDHWLILIFAPFVCTKTEQLHIPGIL